MYKNKFDKKVCSTQVLNSFKVNNYLTLRLEDKGGNRPLVNIYVEDKLFNQCKFLLIDISVDEIYNFDEIQSIDEASEIFKSRLKHKENLKKMKLSPEDEFWAHCSNLQVWYENNYDTRLLHCNLSFPLLKKLSDVGDPVAKKVFQEEIAKRFESGYLPVVSYLLIEHYLEYLPKKYLEISAHSEKIINYLLNAIKSDKKFIKLAGLYLFHELYDYLSKDIIQEFVEIVYNDKKYVHDILYAPYMLSDINPLTEWWTYYDSSRLSSIKQAIKQLKDIEK